ncbi:type IX secretion system ring subunit PorN/GldN [Rufibacter roseus]|uniref:Gliding motility protein GldN n=1 Tax=Rufibacter roseus TaxID=1567108 RepID=A0ABW2DHZ0_9BACT|nr:gliding motility protein GldN [Rufibacter roseus]
MKKLIVLGLAGLMGLPLVTEAQRRNTNNRRTATPARTQQNVSAEQERQRQADLERQQQEQQQSAAAQQLRETSLAANPSARPIAPSDVMFKKTVWRAIDLREKQNQPMFSNGRQISKLIVEAVKRGELQAYTNDSLATPISIATFSENLRQSSNIIGPAQDFPPAAGGNRKTKTITEKDPWDPSKTITRTVYEDTGEEVPGTGAAAAVAAEASELLPNQLYRMELKEDVVFDKKRSRLYHDPQALTLMMPSKFTGSLGIEKTIASFKFSDLVKLFRAHPEEAIWFNSQNNAQHKNLADAFDLWLFSSYITKVSNPTGDPLGNGKNGLLAAQQAMEDLIEWEYSLWSY